MKISGLIYSLSLLCLLTACSTVSEITGSDKLTDSEYQQILARCRKYIQMVNHLHVSNEDKLFVQENPPKQYVEYTGHKQGTMKLLWKINPSYSIRIIINGDLLDEKCPTRMTVSRFQQ